MSAILLFLGVLVILGFPGVLAHLGVSWFISCPGSLTAKHPDESGSERSTA